MAARDTLQQWFDEGQVYDLHLNIGHANGDQVIDGDPQGEHVRRQFSAADLTDTPLHTVGLRTHYSQVTLPVDAPQRLVPSVALNWTGIDPQRVAEELQRFDHPHPIVWFQSFCDPYHRSVIDTAYRRSIAAGGAEQTTITHTDEHGRLSPATLAVLEIARDRGAVVATPHANWERTIPLIFQAVDMGLRVLWVHPDSRLIRTPLAIQQAVSAYANGQAGKGSVFIERAAVFLRDGKPGAYSAAQIVADVRAIGHRHILFSSDLGRYKESDPLGPAEGLRWYMQQLQAAGLHDDEAQHGLITNPEMFLYGG